MVCSNIMIYKLSFMDDYNRVFTEPYVLKNWVSDEEYCHESCGDHRKWEKMRYRFFGLSWGACSRKRQNSGHQHFGKTYFERS